MCDVAGPNGLTKAEAVAKAKGDGKGLLNYGQACLATYLYTGTNQSEWSAMEVTGFASVDTPTGAKEMPEFKFPAGYAQADTPNSGDDCCHLCGHAIKNVYHVQNDAKKLTMIVGSECVTLFGEGKSGEAIAKETKYRLNREFLAEAFDYVDLMLEWHRKANNCYGGWSINSVACAIKDETIRLAFASLVRALGFSFAQHWWTTKRLYPTYNRLRVSKDSRAKLATDIQISNWMKKHADDVRSAIAVIGPVVESFGLISGNSPN